MNNDEKLRLKKIYEELSERKLVEMLSVGKEGYKEGFYELLIEECKKKEHP